jgi:hypothetical protein
MALCNYTAERPLLLWTDFAPDNGGGGAVVLRSLISEKDRAKILWLSPALARGRVTGTRVAPLEDGSLGRTGRRSLFLDSTFLASALAKETLRQAEVRGARALWVVLHGAGVPVAAELVKRSRLPIHLTVHDDPAFGVAMRSRRYLALTPWIERQFALSLRGARSVDVIGEGMRDRYARRYGVESTIVHRTVAGPVSPSPPYDRANGLRVGVLGNMYAYGQLPAFGRALASAGRTLGVRARITFIGNGFGERLKRDLGGLGVEVESTGHLQEAEAVQVLRNCFALYLNYPFTARDAVLRETSFPTKLGTYALAARPIVTHAPTGTTLAPLASFAGYVHPWTTRREADGESLFVRMWRSGSLHASAHEPAERVRRRYFDDGRNPDALTKILNSLVPSFDANANARHHNVETR